MIQPYKGQVLIKQDPDTKEEVRSGIIIQRTHRDRSDMQVNLAWGTVVRVGAECDPAIVEGARVCFNPFDSWDIEDTGEKLVIVAAVGVRGVVHTAPVDSPTASAW